MSYEYSEDGLVETATQEVLEGLGWTVVTAWTKETLATHNDRSDGLLGRMNKAEVILARYLLQALRLLNPDLPHTAYQQAVDLLTEAAADKHLAAINKEKHELLVKGVPVSYQDDKGVLQKKRLKVFDFDNAANNRFLAVRQFEVVGKLYNRRPDVVGFVNGIPLVFFELKAHHTDLRHAFDNNLSDYKDTIPEVLHCNAFVILSNGIDSKVGTLTEVCVVVSSEQNEVQKFANLGLDIEPHRKKMVTRDLETEFKDENNPFRLVIVCAMWITGFDVPCVSTVYLDKPINGHTLVQTIARANRVYDDEKENGLIIDYGNVYKQLEQAYSVYGDGGGKTKLGQKGEDGKGNSVEKLVELVDDLDKAIQVVRDFLLDVGFDLDKLIHAASAVEKLGQLKQATNAVCLNETTRTQYEVAARDVFRKYMALFPEPETKPFLPAFNAIQAIYDQLNQKTKQADISAVIRRLQQEVNFSVSTRDNEVRDVDYVDLSTLDFDKLRAAFAKSSQKNAVVFDLQTAIEKKLAQMVQQNPIRLEFYEKYQKIIDEYNKGKDIQAVQKAFDDLSDFMQNDLSPETERAMREELDEETLAIFDLLKKPELTKDEVDKVKDVAKQTLAVLKAEKLKIERWRESTQVTAQVKTLIDHSLQWLPQEPYPDEEVDIKSLLVYQHVYANYQGAGFSRYGSF